MSMWGKRNPRTLLVGMQASTTTLEKIWRLLQNLNIDLLYDPAIPLLGIYQKECDTGYFRGTCTHVYCSTSHSNQVMETAKMPHYRQMD
jgi:hypothetical protein